MADMGPWVERGSVPETMEPKTYMYHAEQGFQVGPVILPEGMSLAMFTEQMRLVSQMVVRGMGTIPSGMGSTMYYDSSTYYDRATQMPEPRKPAQYYAPHTPALGVCGCPTCTPGGLPEKRCTRAQREATAEILAEQYAAGTLDDDEYHDRLDTAMAAKFPSILHKLTADLPDLGPTPAPRTTQHRDRKWTPSAWSMQNGGAIGAAIGVTAVTSAVTGGNGGGVAVGAVILCCLINCLLGLRKSNGMAGVGLLLGPFLFLGTALMILLTWRNNPDKVRDGGRDHGAY